MTRNRTTMIRTIMHTISLYFSPIMNIVFARKKRDDPCHRTYPTTEQSVIIKGGVQQYCCWIFSLVFFLLVQFKNEFILLFFCVLAGTTLFKLHNSCYAITQLMNYWYCVLNLKYLVLYFWEMMELTVKSCSQVKKFNSIKLYNFYLTNFLHLIPFRKKMI